MSEEGIGAILILWGVGLFLIVCGILTVVFYILKGITWTI